VFSAEGEYSTGDWGAAKATLCTTLRVTLEPATANRTRITE